LLKKPKKVKINQRKSAKQKSRKHVGTCWRQNKAPKGKVAAKDQLLLVKGFDCGMYGGKQHVLKREVRTSPLRWRIPKEISSNA
jgi:hypothetical protein